MTSPNVQVRSGAPRSSTNRQTQCRPSRGRNPQVRMAQPPKASTAVSDSRPVSRTRARGLFTSKTSKSHAICEKSFPLVRDERGAAPSETASWALVRGRFPEVWRTAQRFDCMGSGFRTGRPAAFLAIGLLTLGGCGGAPSMSPRGTKTVAAADAPRPSATARPAARPRVKQRPRHHPSPARHDARRSDTRRHRPRSGGPSRAAPASSRKPARTHHAGSRAPAPQQVPVTADAPQTFGSNYVALRASGCRPRSLTIVAGGIVTWQAAGGSGVVHVDGTSSKHLREGQTFQHQFEKAGRYPFTCGTGARGAAGIILTR